jgi:copper chaperone CopZ
MTIDGHQRPHVLVITVPGMERRDDVRLISARVADVPGVSALRVDLSTKTVTVEGNVSADAITAAIVSAGYVVNALPT